jgi:hypothetical protein
MVAFDRIRVVPGLALLLGGLEVGFAFIHRPPVAGRNPLHARINDYSFRPTTPRQTLMRHGYIRFLSDQSHAVRRVSPEDSSSEVDPSESDDSSKVESEPRSDEQGWGRIKAYFMQGKKDDGLTFRQRLAKMGVATVLSYGMISNLSYAILVALAWYTFSAKVSSTVSTAWGIHVVNYKVCH